MAKSKNKQKLIASLAKGKILDLGFIWNPNPHLKNVVGADIEPCKVKPKNYSKTIVADLNSRFPLKDKSFDTVIAGDVIEHLYNPFGFLNECKRVMKDKGKLIISTPNKHFFHLWSDSPFHLHMWTYNQFKRILNYYFEIEKCYGSDMKTVPSLSHIIIYVCSKKQ